MLIQGLPVNRFMVFGHVHPHAHGYAASIKVLPRHSCAGTTLPFAPTGKPCVEKRTVQFSARTTSVAASVCGQQLLLRARMNKVHGWTANVGRPRALQDSAAPLHLSGRALALHGASRLACARCAGEGLRHRAALQHAAPMLHQQLHLCRQSAAPPRQQPLARRRRA